MARFTSPNNEVAISDIDIDPGEQGTESVTINHGDGNANSYVFELSLRAGETAFLRGFDNTSNRITGLPTRTYTNFSAETKTYTFTINVPQLLEEDLGNQRFLEILIGGDIPQQNNDIPLGGSGEGNPPLNEEDSNNNTGDETGGGDDGVQNPTLSPGSGFGGAGDRTNITINTDRVDRVGGSGTTNEEDSNNNTGDETGGGNDGPVDPTFNPG